ncbi:MAG: Gfo/Idh/MocA family oxidoreductase [Gammaproteobacteria bacterium]|nr:Gfo/Idh/MocA family oxidoreductase [Gammaproteobacteria bacterium]MBU1414169.1 Gfo/Idh/MocA family oxidoreductase [Gammaproteobacteria bacterium]
MSKSSPSFRWGLLGSGAVAHDFARSLELLPDHELIAVSSRSLERANRAREDLGAKRAYANYRALCEDPDVDAIYVATPAALHCEHVDLALSARKPVLCEKPFTVNSEEARKLVQKARTERVFCMEAMWMRFVPAIRELKAEVASGSIGEVRLLSAELGELVPYDPAGRHFAPALGGGSLLDLGVYALSLAWFILGRPIKGHAFSTPAPTGVDSQMIISLTYPNGALASLTCSFEQRLRNMAFVAGTLGSIATDSPLYSPNRLTLIRHTPGSFSPEAGKRGKLHTFLSGHPKVVQLRREYAPLLRRIIRGDRKTKRLSYPGYGYQFEAAEVARCVGQNLLESPVMMLGESLEIMTAIDALRTSGEFDWSAGAGDDLANR